MSNSSVFHAWATGRKAKGKSGNVSFDRNRLYSYGHYCIGYKTGKHTSAGRELVLIQARDYIATTARHISEACRALGPTFQAVSVPSIPEYTDNPDHGHNLAYFQEEAKEFHGKATRAHKVGYIHALALDRTFEDVAAYCTAYGLDFPELARLTDAERQAIEDKATRYKAQEEARREKRLADQRQDLASAFWAWKNGGPYNWGFGCFPVALRIKDGHVETSLGASVTIAQAKEALAAWKAGTLGAGALVGDYTMIRATKDGVQIGCHKIDAEAIEALANELGV